MCGRSRRQNRLQDAGRSWLYVSITTVTAGMPISTFRPRTPSLLRARQYRYNPVNPRIRRNGSSTVASGINAKFFHAARRAASRCPGSWFILPTAFSISVGGITADRTEKAASRPQSLPRHPFEAPCLKLERRGECSETLLSLIEPQIHSSRESFAVPADSSA